MPDRIIVADASSLIALTNISGLELLKDVYGQISITPEIQEEYNSEVPDWIIDERKGRNVAKRLDLKIIGVLGVIIIAKEKGIIDNVRPLIDRLEDVDFRMSEKLKKQILKRVKE